MGVLGISLPELQSGQGNYTRPILIGIFTSVAGILAGYDAGTISGLLATRYFVNEFSTGTVNIRGERIFTPNQGALLVGILSAGTFVGALLAAPFGDYIGRRKGLLVACAIFISGVIFQTVTTELPLFVFGRAVAGVGVGVTSVLAPLYQAETAPAWIRGTVNCTYQFSLTLGIFLAAFIELGTHNISNTASYRIPVALQALWAVILFIGMLFLPETPAYLIKRGDIFEAKKSFKFLNAVHCEEYLTTQIRILQEAQLTQEEAGTGTWKQVFSSQNQQRKRVFTGMMLMALQQLSGINFIFYFGTEFFKNAGIKNPFLVSVIATAVNMLCTFPGFYLVEKWGRRPLLLFGAIGMFVSQMVVAVIGTVVSIKEKKLLAKTTVNINANVAMLQSSAEKMAKFERGYAKVKAAKQMSNDSLITFVCIFIFFFAASWGPVCFVYVSEIFATRLRAKSMALSISSNWCLNLIIAFATPHLTGQTTTSLNLSQKIFFIWAFCNLMATLFVYFFVYETKGLSLDSVDQLFLRCGNARESSGGIREGLLREQEERRDAGSEAGEEEDSEKEGVHIEKLEAVVIRGPCETI